MVFFKMFRFEFARVPKVQCPQLELRAVRRRRLLRLVRGRSPLLRGRLARPLLLLAMQGRLGQVRQEMFALLFYFLFFCILSMFYS